jgi:CelD/BcsL family acetyltransferase involved in cellulose biosynthesis
VIDLNALADRAAWPPKSMARKVRAHQRQLEANGPVALQFVSGKDWRGEILDALAAVEAQSWVGRSTDGSAAKFLKPGQRAAWETTLEDPAIADMLSASILRVGGTPVAFTFDLNVGRVQFGIATGYDERFARCSPGKVIGLRNVEHAMTRGIELFDWGCGNSGYKSAIGAEAGTDIVDCLFVRSRPVAALIRKKWLTGAGEEAAGG